MDLQELGTVVKHARLELGYSQAELGSMCGMDRVRVNKLENAALAEVGWTKVAAILSALDLEFAVRPAGLPPQLDEMQDAAPYLPTP